MKTIGLLGGMSWESTIEYYRAINMGVKEKLGGLHSAKIAMQSVDLGPIAEQMEKENWDEIASILCRAAKKLEMSGADFLVICTNTMHKLAPRIEKAINIPLLHIADATAAVLQQQSIGKVGLLGTAFTMEQDFYRQRLKSHYGLEVLIPEKEQRQKIHEVIFTELCHGKILQQSKIDYLEIMGTFADQGAGGIILGCTEIGLLVKQRDIAIPLFDTTHIHAAKAVEMALVD